MSVTAMCYADRPVVMLQLHEYFRSTINHSTVTHTYTHTHTHTHTHTRTRTHTRTPHTHTHTHTQRDTRTHTHRDLLDFPVCLSCISLADSFSPLSWLPLSPGCDFDPCVQRGC